MSIKISYITPEFFGFDKIRRYRHKIALIIVIKKDIEIGIFICFILLCRDSQFTEFLKSGSLKELI